MSENGRVLIQQINVNFATTNINNSTWTQVLASLPHDIIRLDITNTSTDGVQIAAGASGSEKVVAQVGPGGTGAPNVDTITVLLNQGQRISLKSVFTATLSSGMIFIAAYY